MGSMGIGSPFFPQNSISTKNIPDHRSIGFSSKSSRGFKKFSILCAFDGLRSSQSQQDKVSRAGKRMWTGSRFVLAKVEGC